MSVNPWDIVETTNYQPAIAGDDPWAIEGATTFEAEPADNAAPDVGRLQTAASQFVGGAGSTLLGDPQKAAAIYRSVRPGVDKTVAAFDRIDAGEIIKPEDFAGTDEGQWRALANLYGKRPELREKLRKDLDTVKETEFYAPPTETPLYQRGEKTTQWFQNLIEKNPEFAKEFWAGQLPQGLGSTVGFMGAGLIAGPVGPALSGMASSSVQGFEDALQKGAPLEDAFKSADLNAWVGVSEIVPIADMFTRADRMTGGAIKKTIVSMLQQGTEEAIQEAGQQIAQNLIASDVVKYDPERKTFSGVGENASVGFGAGSIMDFLFTVASGGRRFKSRPLPPGTPPTEPGTGPSAPSQPINAEEILGRAEPVAPNPIAPPAAVMAAETVDDAIAAAQAHITGLPKMAAMRAPVAAQEATAPMAVPDMPSPQAVAQEVSAATGLPVPGVVPAVLPAIPPRPELVPVSRRAQPIAAPVQAEMSASKLDKPSVAVEYAQNEQTVQMRGSKSAGATNLPEVPRISNAQISQGNTANARAAKEGQLPELRRDVSAQAEANQETLREVPRSEQSNAPRGLQQAAGSNVDVPEVSSNAPRGSIVEQDQLQNRSRERLASVAQMHSIAANPDYLRLGPSRAPETGAPLAFANSDKTNIPTENFGSEDTAVLSDGRRIGFRYAVVEAGSVQPSNFADGTVNPSHASTKPGVIRALNNGRVAGLRAAFDRGTAAPYVQALTADSAAVGIDPAAIQGMQRPMLVRLYSQRDNTADIAAKSQGATLGLSATEQAVSDAKYLTSDVLTSYRGGDIVSPANRDFVRAFVGKAGDMSSMMDAGGNLSQNGRRRLEASMMVAAYGDTGIVSELFESTDTDIKAIGDAMREVAGQWADMRDRARAGQIDPQVDITGNLMQAVQIIKRSRVEGKSIYDLVHQADLMAGVVDLLTEGWVRIFYRGDKFGRARSRETVVSGIMEYINGALQTSQEAGLFGESLRVQPADVLKSATEKVNAKESAPAQSGLFTQGVQSAGEVAGNRGPEGQRLVGPSRGGAAAGQAPQEVAAAKKEDLRLIPVSQRPPERRNDTVTRKRIEHMTPDEMREALLRDVKTGLFNDRAYEEHKKEPIQISIDLDSLKWVNDNMGHESGDVMLKAMGEALQRHAAQAYRLGGDEFVVQATSKDHADNIITNVEKTLAAAIVTVTQPGGSTVTKTGVSFSYGYGTTLKESDEKLAESKAKREVAGQRAGRGAEPPGVVKGAPVGKQTAVDQSAEEVAAPAVPAVTKNLSPDLASDKYVTAKGTIVNVKAANKRGQTVTVKEDAAEALVRIDKQESLAQRLLECLSN